MTDLARLPDAVPAVWSSVGDTEAICGAAFITGQQWGTMQGLLVVAARKGIKLLLMRVNHGTVTEVGQLPNSTATTAGYARCSERRRRTRASVQLRLPRGGGYPDPGWRPQAGCASQSGGAQASALCF